MVWRALGYRPASPTPYVGRSPAAGANPCYASDRVCVTSYSTFSVRRALRQRWLQAGSACAASWWGCQTTPARRPAAGRSRPGCPDACMLCSCLCLASFARGVRRMRVAGLVNSRLGTGTAPSDSGRWGRLTMHNARASPGSGWRGAARRQGERGRHLGKGESPPALGLLGSSSAPPSMGLGAALRF